MGDCFKIVAYFYLQQTIDNENYQNNRLVVVKNLAEIDFTSVGLTRAS